MSDFVQLWVYLSATPLFGLTATLVVYVLAHAIYTQVDQAAWANPVLWSVVSIALMLTLTGVSYPTYFSGAQFIHFLLGPAVVALAWPLWERRETLRRLWRGLLVAALAAVFAVLTGMVGALTGKALFQWLKIPTTPDGLMARGFALGTASHGIGAARTMQVNADAGAYAGLALGMQVVLTSLLIPLVFKFV